MIYLSNAKKSVTNKLVKSILLIEKTEKRVQKVVKLIFLLTSQQSRELVPELSFTFLSITWHFATAFYIKCVLSPSL